MRLQILALGINEFVGTLPDSYLRVPLAALFETRSTDKVDQ
jgi:hypothetical protein